MLLAMDNEMTMTMTMTMAIKNIQFYNYYDYSK